MKTLRAALAVLCIAVITLCGILILQKAVGRLGVDLTGPRLYTLSEGTRNILAGLNQPVHLTLYYSRTAAMKGPEDIRYYNNYYLYVRDLLQEYVARADGMLTLEVVDPRAYSDEEDEAIRAGVQRFPLSEDESFFFGLVASTELGKQKAIEFFEPGRQEFVEYDISRLITSVTQREKKTIGILSSLPVMGPDMSPYMMQMMQAQGRTPPQPWTIVSQLRDQYEVVAVQSDTDSIGEEIDYLMVIHPKDLSDRTLYAIDQYVMRGGSLIVFVDPHCLSDQPGQNPSNPFAGMDYESSSDLNRLLSGWGVKMTPNAIAADRALALTASISRGALPERLLTFLQLNEKSMNPAEVVTGRLHSVRVLFAGVLKPVPEAGTEVVPLLSTTATGNIWTPKDAFELRMIDPAAISRAVPDGYEPLMLGCRITGKLKSNFPDGPPGGDEPQAGAEEGPESKSDANADEEPGPQAESLKESTGEATVLVFADVDMISDLLAYQTTFFGQAQVGDNAALVLNAVEFLGGGSDLIAVRSRGRFSRPFVVVDRIEAEAEKATASEVDALNQKIAEYQERLDKLRSTGSDEEAQLLQSQAMAEREKIQEEIRQARKQLRKLNAARREQIEALKARLQTHNMVWAPAMVLMIALTLAAARQVRARRYAARRMHQ